MVECHFCGQTFQKVDLSSIAKCCIKRCNKYYCMQCIRKHFNPQFDMQMYKKDTWICYSCQTACSCEKCKKQEKSQPNNNDKKSARKKVVKPKANEQSIEQSVSNISQNNVKNEGSILPNLLQEQGNMIDEPEEQEMEEECAPQFNFYSQEQILQFPSFYRKIAERRNQFYSFILKEWKKKKLISKSAKSIVKSDAKERVNNQLQKHE